MLNEPGYRRRAEHLRDEMRTAPYLADAVGLLERLAWAKRPLVKTR
jgi:hypothetical protein